MFAVGNFRRKVKETRLSSACTSWVFTVLGFGAFQCPKVEGKNAYIVTKLRTVSAKRA